MEPNTQLEKAPLWAYVAFLLSYISFGAFVISMANYGIPFFALLFYPAIILCAASFYGILIRKKWAVSLTLGLFWTFLIMVLPPIPLFGGYYIVAMMQNPILVVELIIYFGATTYIYKNKNLFIN